MSTQDEEYQAAVDDDDESPRKRRREGSPLSLDDRKSLKEMYCKFASQPAGCGGRSRDEIR